jgi:hypothetical protein
MFCFLIIITMILSAKCEKILNSKLVSTEVYSKFLDEKTKIIDLTQYHMDESGMEQFISYFDNSKLLQYDLKEHPHIKEKKFKFREVPKFGGYRGYELAEEFFIVMNKWIFQESNLKDL